MNTKSITPKWYLAKSDAKHVSQVVITLPPQAEVPSRVTSLVAGADIMMADWAVTSVFMTEDIPEAKGPFVFAKASGVVEMLKGYPASVAFAFYRLNFGGVFQLFVQVDSPKVRVKAGYPYLAEHSRWLDEEADGRLVKALIGRDSLEVCFVAPGANGPCTGFFGLRVDLPEIVKTALKQEWADLLAYHNGLTNRNYQAALDQYNRENPMESTPILPMQLKSQRFEGKTVEEAQAAVVTSGIAQEKIHDSKVTRRVKDATVGGIGKSSEAAIEVAKRRVPSEAFDILPAEIVQQGQEGILEIQAQTETEAREQWEKQIVPLSATLETFKCEIPPKDGFLGIGKKQGLWKAYWSRSFIARITYKLPAQVTIHYIEDGQLIDSLAVTLKDNEKNIRDEAKKTLEKGQHPKAKHLISNDHKKQKNEVESSRKLIQESDKKLAATMANSEHLAKINEGKVAWFKWREQYPDIIPDLRGASLNGRDLRGVWLAKANLSNSNLEKANLQNADLSGANLSNANLNGAALSGANLRGADLRGSNLCGVWLNNADLSSADLREAKLEKAKLENANLSGANLSKAVLKYALLKAAKLIEANLQGADLLSANLWKADLQKADLSEVNLSNGAYLVNTNLSGCNLNNADLSTAHLDSAKLTNADLRGTDLNYASLDGAKLKGAKYDSETVWPSEIYPTARGAIQEE